jgi:hypothetical protein
MSSGRDENETWDAASQYQQGEHIEHFKGYRFKMQGETILAMEAECHECHARYWSYIIRPGSMGHPPHRCSPDVVDGASVINKYG